MELSQIRQQLDELDKQIIQTIAKRMALIPEVAKWKKENNVQRYQPDREKKIIKSKRELAKKLGVNPDLAEDLIKRIIEDSHRIEKEILGE